MSNFLILRRVVLAAAMTGTALGGSPAAAQNTGRLFDRADRNGDGVLTAGELGRPGLLERLDTNSDGRVTRAEAQQAWQNARDGGGLPDGLVVREDVSYAAPGTAHPRRVLDVYYTPKRSIETGERAADPDGPEPRPAEVQAPGEGRPEALRPVVVFVHGGAWRAGDKRVGRDKAAWFTQAGFVYVSINYRLAPEHTYPAFTEDVADAIVWLREHAAEFGGDADRIALVGHSAGAHLVTLAATHASLLPERGVDPASLAAVVSLDTAAHEISPADDRAGRRAMLEHAFGTSAEAHADASPVAHLHADRATPPMLLVYAAARRESRTANTSFAAQVVELGGTTELLAADKDHAGVNRDLASAGDAMAEAVLAFLRRHTASEHAGEAQRGAD